MENANSPLRTTEWAAHRAEIPYRSLTVLTSTSSGVASVRHRAGVILALLSITVATASTPPPRVSLEESFLAQQSERLSTAIDRAVTAAGGSLEREHVNLVFAFSTGHFAKDPTMAEAARLVATQVSERHLVNGDTLSAAAWEMNVWPHQGAGLNPLTISGTRADLRGAVQNLWPRSPRAGSEGGHDTEAVITALTTQYASQPNTVIVLLTNSAASAAGTPTQRTVGENDPQYRRALERWTRVRISNTSGATVQLPFVPDRPERTFDAVVVVPKAFSGPPLDGTRAELVTEQAAPAAPRTPWWPWALGAAALILLGLLLLRARNNRPLERAGQDGAAAAPTPRRTRAGRGARELAVAGRVFPLPAVRAPEELVTLCGPGYPVPPASPRHVLLTGDSIPPVKLLTVISEPRGLRLQPEGDVTIEGELPALLPRDTDGEYRVRLRGRAAAKPGLPPRPFQCDAALTVRPSESEA